MYLLISGFKKYWQIPEMLANVLNIGGFTKCWGLPKCCRIYKILAPSKILADVQNIGVWQKYRRTIESWRVLKSPRLVKYQRIWKKLAARLLFGLGGISNCNFLLDWLRSSRSDPRRCVASPSCRPQVRVLPNLLCFYGRSPSRTVPAAFNGPTCQNIRGGQNYWRQCIFSPIPVKTQKSYLWAKNSYMITVAVQNQLSYSQPPKWRPSSTSGEVAKWEIYIAISTDI